MIQMYGKQIAVAPALSIVDLVNRQQSGRPRPGGIVSVSHIQFVA